MAENIPINQIQNLVYKERQIVNELIALSIHLKNSESASEMNMVSGQIKLLKNEMKKTANDIVSSLEKMQVFKPLNSGLRVTEVDEDLIAGQRTPERVEVVPADFTYKGPLKESRRQRPDSLEKLTISRMKRKDIKIIPFRERKPRRYVKMANILFQKKAMRMIDKGRFQDLSRDLIKANMEFIPASYISLIFFNTLVSFFVAIGVALFFLVFNIGALPPFITFVEEPLAMRLLKVIWLMVAVPGATMLLSYFYPALEKKSIESRINQELPFAVVHMSSISSSMIEPSKIFQIIISTREYPFLEKEFIKIQNEINVYGYDLVTALRNRSYNSPSKKLSELFNGLATTITSGGGLPDFFDKRAASLLFDHRLEKEKQTKASETFMDIYISAVIAAPMILMLVLMMMRISGLGISLSTGMISLIMVLAVSLINILFLAFLHLKQPEGV